MPGALVNGASTSDRVVITAAAGVNTLSTATYLQWVNLSTLTNQRRLWSKINAGTGFKGLDIYLSGTSGFLEFDCFTGAGSPMRITNSIPITTGNWFKVAFVLDLPTAAAQMHIYVGQLGTALAEATYSTNVNGGGATASNDSAADLVIFNANGFANAVQGSLGQSAVFGAAMPMADCESWFQQPRSIVGSTTAGMFGRPGQYGADFIEYTGKTATVTGATQGNGPPIVQGDVSWQHDPSSGLTLMAA